MSCPPGMSTPRGVACLLKKSLYGLKQAPRQWYMALADFLTLSGFHSTYSDPCVFVKFTSSGIVVLIVYVDDILLTGDDLKEIADVKSNLHSQFTIKDLRSAVYFLGFEIQSSAAGYSISQVKYATDLFTEVDVPFNSKVHTPSAPQSLGSDGVPFDNPSLHRRMIGKLLFLGFSRPNLCYSVQQLSQFMHAPTIHHWKAVIQVL